MKRKNKIDIKEFFREVVDAYKEARTYDDEHLYRDHIGWLKNGFDEGWFEFPDDYDFDTNRWTIGLLLAQTERYGGIIMDTKRGTIPYIPNIDKEEFRNYLNENNLMNEFDPKKVTYAFGMFCLSKLEDSQIIGLLNEFRELFHNEVSKKSNSHIQLSSPNDEITQQHKEMESEKEVEAVTTRSLDDLNKTLMNLKLDKDNWRKIFDEVLKDEK